MENMWINVILVVTYNLLCYIPAIYPSNPSIVERFTFTNETFLRFWFLATGILFIISVVILLFLTIKKRKALGGQDTPSGLMVGDVYQFSRHPIYFSIILNSLGLALVFFNFDGLIIIPLVILANFLEAKSEESFDMIPRFGDEYKNYKTQTKMFGSIWIWIVILAIVILPTLVVI